MEIILIIAVYILGCVLAYGRVRASLFDIGFVGFSELYITVTFLSWIGFVAGIMMYYQEKEQTFFKFK